MTALSMNPEKMESEMSNKLPADWAETISFLRKVPFVTDGLTFMPVLVNRKVPLAATDGNAIMINPEAIDAMGEKMRTEGKPWFATDSLTRAFIVLHELFHPLFRDEKREMGRNHKTWNMAADYINNGIISDLFRMPPFNFPASKISEVEKVLAAHFLFDPKYKNQTKEEVYVALEKECGGDGGDGGKPCPDGGSMTNPGKGGGGLLEDDFGNGVTDSGVPADIGEIIDEKLEHYMSENASKMQGMGSGTRDAQLAAKKPPITMKKILRKIRDVVPASIWSYVRPGRMDTWMSKQGIQGRMPNPSPDPGTKVRQIVVAVDSSGSVGPKEMACALAMVRDAFKHSPNPVRVLSVNTKCYDKGMIKDVGTLDMSESGGTHLACMIDFIKESKIKPSVIVLITDAYDDSSSIERFKRWAYLPKMRTVVVGNPNHCFPGQCFPCDIIDADIARRS